MATIHPNTHIPNGGLTIVGLGYSIRNSNNPVPLKSNTTDIGLKNKEIPVLDILEVMARLVR